MPSPHAISYEHWQIPLQVFRGQSWSLPTAERIKLGDNGKCGSLPISRQKNLHFLWVLRDIAVSKYGGFEATSHDLTVFVIENIPKTIRNFAARESD